MDWIPVYAEDISAEYTLAQVGALVKFKLLIARLKRMPTDKEVSKEFSLKAFQSLTKVMTKLQQSHDEVCIQTLSSVDKYETKSNKNRDRQAKHRLKMKERNALRNNVPLPLRNSVHTNKDINMYVKEKDKKETTSLSSFPRHKDPQTWIQGQSYDTRTLNVLQRDWKQHLRGNDIKTEYAFDGELITLEGVEREREQKEILECYYNYCDTDVVKAGKINGLLRWLGEWRNYASEKKVFDSLDEALEHFESNIKQEVTA